LQDGRTLEKEMKTEKISTGGAASCAPARAHATSFLSVPYALVPHFMRPADEHGQGVLVS